MTRIERFKEIAAYHGIPESHSTASEDYDEYVAAPETIQRFCAITVAGDATFLKPDYQTLEGAQAGVADYMFDDIYAELPHSVRDLDTGQEWVPARAEITWTSPASGAAEVAS